MSLPLRALALVFPLLSVPAAAQVCLVSADRTSCEGPECEPNFEDDSTSGLFATASVDLDNRRARVHADQAANNRATAVIGYHFRSAYTMEVDFLMNAAILGVLQGGVLGSTFGQVSVRAGLRNVSDGTVDEEEVFFAREDDSQVTVIPQNPLAGPVREFSAALEQGDEYELYFRIEARSRGALGNSDFATGARGLTFTNLEITFPLDDSDGDGLYDVWETDGIPGCGVDEILLDLESLGADPDKKDIFVEYDWLPGRDPVASTIQAVKDAFAAAPGNAGGIANPDGTEGINIWIDTGNAATGDDLGGGNQIPLTDVPNGVSVGKLFGDADADGVADFYEVKAENFDFNRQWAFHYVIGGPSGTVEQGAGAGSCTDGVDNDGDGLVDSDDTGDCFRNSQAELGGNDFFLSVPGSGIFMHELGHNLNLRHGGFENRNCKPNYISVMNYTFQNGIPQDTNAGQDTDADGMADFRIIDFSPPRLPGGGRAAVPTEALDEIAEDGLNGDGLDETVILDPSDTENMTAFTDGTGTVRTMALDGRLDWSGDDLPPATPDDTGVTANINAGPASACAGNPLNVTPHQPHDDWAVVQLNFLQFGEAADAPVNPTTEPEPSEEDLADLLERLYTTDLAITKTIAPSPQIAGQEVEIAIAVENVGPNHTLQTLVTDAFPEELTPVGLPDPCTADAMNVVTCDLGRLRSGDTANISLRARIDRAIACEGGRDIVSVSNTAEVANGAGSDTNPRNDSDTARLEVICLRFEYAAKFICGDGGADQSIPAVPGLYETIVNVHNFQNREMPFFKKLALAFPPRTQEAGTILPIGIDRLGVDEALKADCDDLRDRLFRDDVPGDGFFEGYLVVQSPRRLDVDAVYTAGLQDGVRSVHVEEVTERDMRTALSIEKRADVIEVPLPEFGAAQFRVFLVLYTVDVVNGGVAAENLTIEDRVSLGLFGPVAGAFLVPEVPFEIPPGASRDPVQVTPFPPAAEFTVTLPELAADAGAQIRFWAVVLTYAFGSSGDTSTFLINRAEVTAGGADTNAADNRVEIYTTLVP